MVRILTKINSIFINYCHDVHFFYWCILVRECARLPVREGGGDFRVSFKNNLLPIYRCFLLPHLFVCRRFTSLYVTLSPDNNVLFKNTLFSLKWRIVYLILSPISMIALLKLVFNAKHTQIFYQDINTKKFHNYYIVEKPWINGH